MEGTLPLPPHAAHRNVVLYWCVPTLRVIADGSIQDESIKPEPHLVFLFMISLKNPSMLLKHSFVGLGNADVKFMKIRT
jgi:hypothetical protein